MSLLDKYLAGVGFRTSTPAFEPGEEIAAFITGYDGDTPVARVGDTVLQVEGAPADVDVVDTRVRLRVESFDAGDHAGTATYLERVGESAF